MTSAANTSCDYASMLPRLNQISETLGKNILAADLPLDKLTKAALMMCKLWRMILDVNREALKQAMLRDPAWRWRVFADLGGVHGMKRWFLRCRAASIVVRSNAPLPPTTAANSRHNRANHPPQAQSDKRYKTDQAGQFRLAPIPRASRPRAVTSDVYASLAYQSKPAVFQPIEIHPAELLKAVNPAAPNRHSGYAPDRSCHQAPRHSVIPPQHPP